MEGKGEGPRFDEDGWFVLGGRPPVVLWPLDSDPERTDEYGRSGLTFHRVSRQDARVRAKSIAAAVALPDPLQDGQGRTKEWALPGIQIVPWRGCRSSQR